MHESTAQATPATADGAAQTEAADSLPSGAAPPQAEPAQPTPEQRKYKLKFGKENREVDESTLLAMAQKGWAADEKFQTAARQQKQVQQLLSQLQQDPDGVLRALGVQNPTELYRQRLAEHLKLEMLNPAERKALELERQVRQYQEREKASQEEQKQSQLKQLESHYAHEYDKQISEAIGTVGVPKTARTVARMADLMAKNLENGLELPPKAIAEIVKDEYLSEMKELLGGYGDEKLLDMLGGDLLKKIQTMDAKRRRVPAKSVSVPQRVSGEPRARVDGDGKVIASKDEWREHIEQWKNSGG